jgi:membrane-anchored protein YejM (alkaline phosphatase superfamily)
MLATLGVVGDQISTRIGLLNPNIMEFNPITRFLISVNAWFIFDMLILGITIGASYLFLRKVNVKNSAFILVYPILIGSLRLFATVLNLQIILSI